MSYGGVSVNSLIERSLSRTTLISLINSTEHSLVVDMVVDMAYQHLEGTAVLLHLRPLRVRLLLEPIPSMSLALYFAGYTHLTFSCPSPRLWALFCRIDQDYSGSVNAAELRLCSFLRICVRS
jgi:hypothetical protein